MDGAASHAGGHANETCPAQAPRFRHQTLFVEEALHPRAAIGLDGEGREIRRFAGGLPAGRGWPPLAVT